MPALPLPWGRQTSGGSQPHGGLPRQTQGTPFSAALALLSTRRQDLRRVRLEKSAEVCHLPAGSRSALSSSRTPRLAPPCDGRTPRSPRGRPTPLAESQRVPRERAAAQTVTRHPPRCQQPRAPGDCGARYPTTGKKVGNPEGQEPRWEGRGGPVLISAGASAGAAGPRRYAGLGGKRVDQALPS